MSELFVEKSGGRYFEYNTLDNPAHDLESYWDLEAAKSWGATHMVRISQQVPGTLPGDMSAFRAAKVLKTVAYIAVDHDENGETIWEKWQIRQK